MMTLAQRLKLDGRSDRELAQACGLNPSSIHRFRYGREPKVGTALRLARALGCRLEDIARPFAGGAAAG